MSATATTQTAKAVIQRLRANAAVVALVTGIHDAVPQDRTFPYLVLDEFFEVPERTLGGNGHRVLFSVFIYTRDGSEKRQGTGSAGYKKAFDLVELIVADLTSLTTPLVVANHDTVDVDVEAVIGTRDDDGVTREVECQFNAWLEDA